MRSSIEMLGIPYVREIESAKVVFPLSGGPIKMMRGGLDSVGGVAVWAHIMLASSMERMIRKLFSMWNLHSERDSNWLVCHGPARGSVSGAQRLSQQLKLTVAINTCSGFEIGSHLSHRAEQAVGKSKEDSTIEGKRFPYY
jgi:hypothetical protein